MARSVYADRVEVFAFKHPDVQDAMVRALRETLELIQRPDNKGVFALHLASFSHTPGEIRVVLPYLEEEVDEDYLVEDTPGEVYDLSNRS